MLNTYLFVGIVLALFLHVKGAYNIPESEFTNKVARYSFGITAVGVTMLGWLPLVAYIYYKNNKEVVTNLFFINN